MSNKMIKLAHEILKSILAFSYDNYKEAYINLSTMPQDEKIEFAKELSVVNEISINDQLHILSLVEKRLKLNA